MNWLWWLFWSGGEDITAGFTYAPLGELNRQSVRLDTISRDVKPMEINRNAVRLEELNQ